MSIEHWWSDNDRGKLKYLKRNLTQYASLSTTKPTWTGLGWNLAPIVKGHCLTNCATTKSQQRTWQTLWVFMLITLKTTHKNSLPFYYTLKCTKLVQQLFAFKCTGFLSIYISANKVI